MGKIASSKPEFIKVRRQPNDYRIATYAFEDVKNYRWDNITGGSKQHTANWALFAIVSCTQMIEGEVGHSGIHGPCPHDIKVAITRKDNPASYDFLASLAGQKPANTNRKQLKKADKADIIYLMWTAKTASEAYNQSNLSNTPDIVYANTANAAFIKRCKKAKVNWGLISPTMGIWLYSDEKIHVPSRLGELTQNELQFLTDDIKNKLGSYANGIRVYSSNNCDRTALHKKIIDDTGLKALMLNTIKDIGVK